MGYMYMRLWQVGDLSGSRISLLDGWLLDVALPRRA